MKIFRRLLPFLKPYAGRTTLLVLLNILFSLLGTATIVMIQPILRLLFYGNKPAPSVTPAAAGPLERWLAPLKEWFVDGVNSLIVAPNDNIGTLRNLCFVIVGVFVLKNIFKYAAFVLNTQVEESVMKDVRDRLYHNTLGLSLGFFNARRSGELMSIVTNDVGTMNGVLTPMVGTLTREPVQILITILLLLAYSPILVLIALSSSVLSLAIMRVITHFTKRYAGRMQAKLSDITSRLQETFQNIRIIKGYAAEQFEEQRFRTETTSYVRSAVKHSRAMNLSSPTHEIFGIVALAVVLFYGGYQVFHGQMSADELMAFLFLLFGVMQPITSVLSIPASIQRAMVSAERVLAIMDTAPSVVPGTRHAQPLRHELQFLNVGFEYRPGIPVVRDLTLTVKRGQTVALVGPSGAGKSTLTDLIIRLYDPTSGGIHLDGIDVREFDFESYRALFGIVTQESILFNDSVRNNIAYNLEEMSQERIIEAAKMANAHEFITRMPDGYDTMIGDRGVLLSGGQRQRLAIARALARDPQILLFDEATSALDTESEALVQEAINNLLVNRTAIVIAHRLSTVKNADVIVVIENGTIVESGTHEELLTAGRLYKKLYDVQFRES
jgi:subfamily B ATP-binding cassette protein MsbA